MALCVARSSSSSTRRRRCTRGSDDTSSQQVDEGVGDLNFANDWTHPYIENGIVSEVGLKVASPVPSEPINSSKYMEIHCDEMKRYCSDTSEKQLSKDLVRAGRAVTFSGVSRSICALRSPD